MIIDQAGTENQLLHDPHAAWLASNAALCLRMDARITEAGCLDNQRQSKFDNRCTGCRGLFDQAVPVAAAPLSFVFLDELEESQQAQEETDVWTASDSHNRPELDEDALEELLAKYFPDDEADQEAEEQKREPVYLDDPKPDKGRRVPVYVGRCARCGGYMVNALERYDGIKDDDVYRCFTCSWRTSPGYKHNRALHAKGM